MRSNSGSGKSESNRGNPPLDEQEQSRGRSGEAITGAKKTGGQPDRASSRTGSNRN